MDNPILLKTVKSEAGLKELLVNYVGSVAKPENDEVTVEMIVTMLLLRLQMIQEEYIHKRLLSTAVKSSSFFLGHVLMVWPSFRQ